MPLKSKLAMLQVTIIYNPVSGRVTERDLKHVTVNQILIMTKLQVPKRDHSSAGA